jgi:rhamnosyltransferase
VKKNSNKAVTIIIRTKNCEEILGQVLSGLESQDYTNYVVEAVDSGSTDRTIEILEEYGISYTAIEAARYQPGPVLNDAVGRAETPLVAFLNSDTVPLRKDALRKLLEPMKDENIAGAYARQISRPDAHSWVRRDYLASFPESGPKPSWIELSLPFAVIRKSAWEEHNFYSMAWASEDTEWGAWAKSQGKEVVYVPEALVMHSHNYTLSQIKGRKFVEGEADAFIFGAKPSLLKMLWRIATTSIKDMAYCISCSDGAGFLAAPVRRIVYHVAWEQGCRLGFKRKREGNTDPSAGQKTVLASY